jgi:hypothetical protein
MKRMEVDYYFVRECVALKQLQIKFISSKDQLVDIFVKQFARLHVCAVCGEEEEKKRKNVCKW